MSMQRQITVLVDESVWLALCLDVGKQAEEAYEFLEATAGVVQMLVTTECLQDVWSDICHVLRHVVVAEGGVLDERVNAFVTSIAWDCVAFVRQMATVITSGAYDAEVAASLQELHPNYRDAMLVATAQGCQVNCVVSFEESLHECLPVRCLTPQEALLAYRL